MFRIINHIINETSEFIDNPIKKTIKVATQPIRDSLKIIDGLTEGELRTKATIRLGADIATGMALRELIEWYKND